MKKLGIFGGVILSTALLVSSASAVMASGSEAAPAMTATAQGEQKYQGIFGTVTGPEAIDNLTLSINLDSKKFDGVEVFLDEYTVYKVPGQEEASVTDIKTGSRLAILATIEDDVYTADRIMVVPGEPTYGHLNGVVVSNNGETLKLMSANGETHQINMPEGVQGGQIGELVSVTLQNASGEGLYVACGLKTATMIQTTFMNQLNEAAGQGAGTQAQEQNVDRLTELCDGLVQRHMEILQGVLDKVPAEVQASIQEQLNIQEQIQAQLHQTINEANAGSGGQNSN